MALRHGRVFRGKLPAGRLFAGGFGVAGAAVRFVLRMASTITRVIKLESRI